VKNCFEQEKHQRKQHADYRFNETVELELVPNVAVIYSNMIETQKQVARANMN